MESNKGRHLSGTLSSNVIGCVSISANPLFSFFILSLVLLLPLAYEKRNSNDLFPSRITKSRVLHLSASQPPECFYNSIKHRRLVIIAFIK